MPSPLGYIPAIARLRAKTVAVLLVAAVGVAAVAVGLTVAFGKTPGHMDVRARVVTGQRFEIANAGRVDVKLRSRRAGSVRVTPVLKAGGSTTALGAPRTVTVGRRRWTDASLPLSPAGRSALGGCPAGRVGVRWKGGAATRPLRLDAPACARFFGPAAIWNQPLPDDAPLDPNSGAVTADLMKKIDAGLRTDKPPTINTTEFAPPVYTVPGNQTRVQVRLDRGEQAEPALAKAFASVPLPATAVPAPGTDSELVVWQPSTDTLWEFWRLRRDSGRWFATWGGRLDNVSKSQGHFDAPHPRWGTTASSLPLVGGLITPQELRRGVIDHALSIGMPGTRAQFFSLPAQRTDGSSPCPYAAPEGARFRLDPKLDVDALGLPPAVAAMARAAQRYGIYVRDQSGAVSFYAQSTVSLPADPYPVLFGGQKPYDLLRSFPWQQLQLVKMELRQDPGDPAPLPGSGILYGC